MSGRVELRRARVDAWLERGGVVLAATDRAARALVAEFEEARRAVGKTAWATPTIFGWDAWILERWRERNRRGLVVLNSLQEQAVWGAVIGESAAGATVLHPGRLAEAAMRAARLLAEFAPGSLRTAARAGWGEDAGIFSEWLAEFDGCCRRDGLVSACRLVLKLTALLADGDGDRPKLLLVGFDRLLETQRALLDSWGVWELDEIGERASEATYLMAQDAAVEVGACVEWLRRSLGSNPAARLMVVTTGLAERRGELERALLDTDGLEFEFSLGVPLGRVGLVRAALLLLRWLREPLTEPELDWLIGSGFGVAGAEEGIALAEAIRKVRNRGRERPEWGLGDFFAELGDCGLEGWIGRLKAALDLLEKAKPKSEATEWVLLVSDLLEAAGWPGFRVLGSVGYQAQQRWERVLEDCGSLGFDGARMEWGEFLAALNDAVAGTIFAAESRGASIQITEPIAAAGQLADGIWFLGATEESWPGRGQANPLLPVGLQREMGMPHANSQADWELAAVATERLLASADEVIFSYARISGDSVEARPSRLVVGHLGLPVNLMAEGRKTKPVLAETFEDWSRVPYAGERIRGGAGVLTRQSVCPFQAFGTTRLGAEDWQAAEAGLNARQRGQLLHAVLHKVWGGPKAGGVETIEDLQRISDLRDFVGGIVRRVMLEEFDSEWGKGIPARFPQRFLTLETERLTRRVCEWLEYERQRLPFRVEGTEIGREVVVGGLSLRVRLDRLDVLADGSRLVMDYKSGPAGPAAWSGNRPDDVQLPLYAAFALEEGSGDHIEGLVFAGVRAGEMAFAGRVRSAQSSLMGGLSSQSGLVRHPLDEAQLDEWREVIEQLGRNFLDGRAEVDPKDPKKTCERCHLHAVCRIYENASLVSTEDEEETVHD